MRWLIDAIPWWTYLLAFGLLALVTIQLWLPAAITLWNALPNWARFALGGFLAVFLAYIAGRNKGRRNELERQKARDAKAVEQRRKTNAEVDKMSDAQVKKELDKWNRD